MQTSRRQISLFTEETLTSSAGASHANPTQPQAKDWGKMTSDISGPICLDAFGRFSHVGSWARMFSALLIGMEGWSSMKCRLTWKLKGTKSNRMFFQLQASTLPTEEIESGLLPTITASFGERGGKINPKSNHDTEKAFRGLLLTPTSVMTDEPPEKMRERAERNGYKNGTQYGSLLSQVKYSGMLPTPIAGDWKGQRRADGTASMLSGKASLGMLPTPTTSCANGGTKAPRKDGKTRESELNHWATINRDESQATGKTSQLNPQFVEEMMGFPENWTASPFQSGATNQSKPTETP